MIKEFNIEDEFAGIRIDKVLTELVADKSRSYLQKLLKEGSVFVNHEVVKSNYKLIKGDRIVIEIPEDTIPDILPQNIPLDILYEDEDLLLVNKPKNMVVHPSAGHTQNTLVNAVMYHCKGKLSGINGVLRPGIVHRIDKDTTGVLVVCKNDMAHQSLAKQLKEHTITRKYRAIIFGNIKEDGSVSGKIGRHPIDRKKMAINEKNGKEAVTHYRILENFKGYTYIECQLETGRTHQIRVHLSSIGHPLLGDNVYGRQKQPFALQGQTLHAMVLGFVHPRFGEYIEVEAPLPEYFESLLKKLSAIS